MAESVSHSSIPDATADVSPCASAYRHARVLAAIALGCALLSSGAAGLVNQVVWQRALKVFLGGSETISSMIVVLVFMGGLGAGSIWMGKKSSQIKDPVRAIVLVELLLALANTAICFALGSRLTDSVFAFQQLALRVGLPLPVLYALCSLLILSVPCFLMGATMPLAAEVCQRSLGWSNARLLGLLFFINTLGSVIGTVVASGYMIAQFGQQASLMVAVGFNVIAGISLLCLYLVVPKPTSHPEVAARRSTETEIQRSAFAFWPPTLEHILALALGFCSLGYEMYLFRIVALKHEPLPFTFAAVLSGFLLFWSLGAACSAERMRLSLPAALRWCAFFACASVPMFVIDTLHPMQHTGSIVSFVILRCPYFIPCWFFGYLFGRVAARAARSWGHDVGGVYAWNTAGSCLGILIMTLVGYELPFFLMVLIIALLLYALQEYFEFRTDPKRRRRIAWLLPLGASVGVVLLPQGIDFSGIIPGIRMYYGRDGVIGIDDNGKLSWDGLWHSQLAKDGSHIGTNNWYFGVCPVMAHKTGDIENVCVVGVAAGISTSTLAKLNSVKSIDAYDINHTLEQIYENYPEGTLHVRHNPKVQFIWQDARSGLALNSQKYDIIATQPLYLKQAGSALLNSVEFFELCSRRLKPNGILSVFAHGTSEQALVVRQTAKHVFEHGVSLFGGYLLLLSNDPIELDPEALSQKLRSDDPLWQEIRQFDSTQSATKLVRLIDDPPLDWGDGRLVITDDHPIVEYPAYLQLQLQIQAP